MFELSPPFLAMGIEQIIVLAAVALFYALKNLFEKKAGAGGAPKPTDPFGGPSKPAAGPPPVPAAPPRPMSDGTKNEEEKMRRFFEALGLPTDALPPAPVAPPLPKQVEPPKPQAIPPPLRKAEPKPKPAPTSTPPPFTPVPALDFDPSPGQLAGNMHEVDPKYDYASVTSEFRDAAKLGAPTKVSVEVDVRPDLMGRAAIHSGPDTAPKRDGESFGYRVAHGLRQDPDAIRRALVIQEVLGKPIALRETQIG